MAKTVRYPGSLLRTGVEFAAIEDLHAALPEPGSKSGNTVNCGALLMTGRALVIALIISGFILFISTGRCPVP